MSEKDDKKRLATLRKLITYHQRMYHTFDDPQISDDAYDALRKELEVLERKYKVSDSPAQKIGGETLEGFEKVAHQHPMLSFTDAFSIQEMEEWVKRVETYLHTSVQKEKKPFYGELKIDGIAVELEYERGELKRAITRGDGKVGEDVSAHMKHIEDIPSSLEKLGPWPIPQNVILRGEIYINKDDFERINKEREKKGEVVYANTRNLAAGSIRQLDTQVSAKRRLRSFQYDIVIGLPGDVSTHEEEHKVLSSWGCVVNEHNRALSSLQDLKRFKEQWEKKRDSLPYEVDGIVVLINNNIFFERAGAVGKAPRGAIAYKFTPKEAVSEVVDIHYQVGRSGVITPVAVLDPVRLGGVVVSHATLHNFDEVERLGIMKGDSVIITRSGDVIPKIISVIKDLRDGKEERIKIPQKCPIDGSVLVQDGVYLRCPNPSCYAQQIGRIIHLVSRDAFDIRGLGAKVIERLYKEGIIATIADVFSIEEGDIAQLEGFGEKSASNIVKEIEKKKIIRTDRFLYALGIPHVGIQTAQTLAQTHRKKKISISDLFTHINSLDKKTLQKLPDIGEIVSEEIVKWFSLKEHQTLLKELEERGVRPEVFSHEEGVFSEKTFCLTGTLSSFSRQRAKEVIQSEGGNIASDVVDAVDVLLAGDSPGSKYNKAKEKGVSIWDEKTFLSHLPSSKRV